MSPRHARAAVLTALLTLAGCAAPPVPPVAFTLTADAPAAGRVIIAIAPTRTLLADARRWRTTDVCAYTVTLDALPEPTPAPTGTPDLTSTPESPPHASRTLTLPARSDAPTEAVFDALQTGHRYRVTVLALGNAGGTAPDMVLNQTMPATAELDLVAPTEPVRLALDVPLDATVFDGTLTLPNRTTDMLPAWLTRLSATLNTPTSPVARASWAPSERAHFAHVRGDTPYRIDFTVTSAAGSRTLSLPGVRIDATDGDATQHLAYPDIAPPTGTLLSTRTLTSAFGVAVDAQQRLWISNQHHDTVNVLNTDGTTALPTIPVGNEPRGIAIDPSDDTVWVANYAAGTVSKIVNGAVVGTYSPGGFFFRPGGIAVDAQHRVWLTSVSEGRVRVLNANGTVAAGSPYTVGSQPAGLAIDPETGDIWVANSASGSISKISGGVVSGPFTAPGLVKPGGIAVAPDHTVWVSDGRTGVSAVQRFSADGEPLGTALAAGVAATGLAVDPVSGIAWCAAQSGMRIFRYDATTPPVTLVNYSAGTIGNQVAIDARGHVWVAGNGTLTEIAP